MTDRELLELAAKAAGYGEVWSLDGAPDVTYIGPRYTGGAVQYRVWNPLTDDGDALRLAVRLQFHVGINPGNKIFCTPTYSDKPTVFESCERGGVQDPLAATRRAIVRAAAEIGRSKE